MCSLRVSPDRGVRVHILRIGAFVACDLNPYPLLLKEKGDDGEADCP